MQLKIQYIYWDAKLLYIKYIFEILNLIDNINNHKQNSKKLIKYLFEILNLIDKIYNHKQNSSNYLLLIVYIFAFYNYPYYNIF